MHALHDHYQHPFAIYSIPPGQSSLALKPLPVEALRLPPETVELLHSLGIVRIEQLELLPREELSCRFGPCLVQRLDQAAGRLAEPIPVHLPPPRFAARHELEYPTASREAVALVLERLVWRLADRLVCSGRGAIQLECRLDCQSGGSVPISVGLFQPTASPRHLNELILMRLERTSTTSPIVAISIEATLTGPLDHRQEELFSDGQARSRWRLLAILIDRLASRLGRRSVLQPRLVPEAQPELAYQYTPLVFQRLKNGGSRPARNDPRVSRPVRNGSEKLSSRKGEEKRFEQRRTGARPCASNHVPCRGVGEPPDRDLPPRPLRLLRQPRPISAISILPDGPPFSFRLRNQEHRILWIWGPERLETGWWRGRSIARDYYRVETATGHRFWLFRSLEEGRWFLHGDFE